MICAQTFTLQAAISHYSNHYEGIFENALDAPWSKQKDIVEIEKSGIPIITLSSHLCPKQNYFT